MNWRKRNSFIFIMLATFKNNNYQNTTENETIRIKTGQQDYVVQTWTVPVKRDGWNVCNKGSARYTL